MSFSCPVCNGLEGLAGHCPACGSELDDQGRLSDLFGPYSPYRPIDESKLTNGLPDLALHLCVHLAVCPTCGKRSAVAVTEREL